MSAATSTPTRRWTVNEMDVPVLSPSITSPSHSRASSSDSASYPPTPVELDECFDAGSSIMPLPLIVHKPCTPEATPTFDDDGEHGKMRRWLSTSQNFAPLSIETGIPSENIIMGMTTSISPRKLEWGTDSGSRKERRRGSVSEGMAPRTPLKHHLSLMAEEENLQIQPSLLQASPYPGSSRSSSPSPSPTAMRRATITSPSKTTTFHHDAQTSPIKTPARVQMSPKKKNLIAPPPPYSRNNTFTYSVKHQQHQPSDIDGPPFPSLLHSIPNPHPFLTSGSSRTSEDDTFFVSTPLSAPWEFTPRTKPFGLSHAFYDHRSPLLSAKLLPPHDDEGGEPKVHPRRRVLSFSEFDKPKTSDLTEKPATFKYEYNAEPVFRPSGPTSDFAVSSWQDFAAAVMTHVTAAAAWMGRQSDSTPAWLTLYFVFNLGLTLYNKSVLVRFPFPYTLTALHAFCGTVGTCWLWWTGYFTPARLSTRENVTLSLFSVLYTLNIAVSNVSLQLVTIPFHQVVRASAPLFIIVIAYVLMPRSRSNGGFLGVGQKKLMALIPVMIGVALATYGDYYFTKWGMILTLFGTFLAALKTVITNLLQTTPTTSRATLSTPSTPTLPLHSNFTTPKTPYHPAALNSDPAVPVTTSNSRFKLHPLDLLLRMSPLALLQCVVYAYLSGEMGHVAAGTMLVRNGTVAFSTKRLGLALFGNGWIAFGLNVVSFTANKKTGPLAMTVAANIKQVLTILLAVMIFNLQISLTNVIGICLTLAGGMWYAAIEYKDKQRKTRNLSFADVVGEREKESLISR